MMRTHVTLTDALDHAASGTGGMRFHDTKGHLSGTCTYAQLQKMSWQISAALARRHLHRLDRIALIAQTQPEFPGTFFACQYLGLLPCNLPYPIASAGYDASLARLQYLLEQARPALLVGPADIAPFMEDLQAATGIAIVTYESLLAEVSGQDHSAPAPEHRFTSLDPAYIQFSSGSTASPKSLLVSQTAITHNIHTILYDGLRLRADDRAFSWLPCYHDMGLVGFMLAPVYGGVSIDYLPPAGFARRPGLWLELMSACRSTITYAPDFAYALAMRRTASPDTLDLSTLRIAGVGGDMIRANTLSEFVRHMHPAGFRSNAFTPSYGLAEATLAVAITPAGSGPRMIDHQDSGHAHTLVSSGPCLPGWDIRIEGPSSCAIQPGPIWIKGPSLAQEWPVPALHDISVSDHMPTGDIGFIHDGHLYITGRQKDTIIIRGRNHEAQDIEWTACDCLPGLQAHHVCAISDEEGQRLTLLIEAPSLATDKRRTLAQLIEAEISRIHGICTDIVWLSRGQLLLTPSGKLARSAMRKAYMDGSLDFIVPKD